MEKKQRKELIRIKGGKIDLALRVLDWVDESGTKILYVPSIDMSAYGDTPEEARLMLNECFNEFCSSIHKLSVSKRNQYLFSLGWSQERLSKKNYSRAHIDKQGVLRDLDFNEKELDKVGDNLLELSL